MIQQWQSLLNQLEIVETPYGSELWSLEELNQFESENNIVFPLGYKEFCQIFGTGCFGDFISIFCPNIYFSTICLEAIKNDITEFPDSEHERMMSKESLLALLDSSFVFGREPSANSIFWDLRTYNKSDNSYDIYWANSDCFSGDIYKIGRDFYKFVTEFCLGEESYKILPEKEWTPKETLAKTFTRARPNW